MPRIPKTSFNSIICSIAYADRPGRRSLKAEVVLSKYALLTSMTTRRPLTTMVLVSTITPRCQDTMTMRRASRQARKCPTTCHSLITAQHGTRWMTLIMTQTQTRRKLPISWMCEVRRRRGPFFELLFGPVITVHCIPHLYTTNHLLPSQYANTYCSSMNHSAGLRDTVLRYCCTGHIPCTECIKLGPTHNDFCGVRQSP